MKIALYNVTTTLTAGGVETFVWEIARELARRGHEVDVIGGDGPIVREIPGVRVIRRPFISRGRFPNLGTRFRRLMERLSFGLHCRKDLLAGDYDWIYIQKPYDLLISIWLKKRTGTRILLGLHGDDFFPGDRWFARRVDACVACSALVRDEARTRYGIEPVVIYNGVDPDTFSPGPPDPATRRRFALAPQNQVVVTTGRLVSGKGIDLLIRAFARLKLSDGVLMVVGDGPERQKLESLAAELRVRAIFTGWLKHDEIAACYRCAAAAVFPSRLQETFGMAVAEAMATGVPVIASRTGALPELITDGETGHLVPAGDAESLARRLKEILDNRGSAKIGRTARESVVEKLTWPAVTGRLAPLIEG